MDYGIVDILMLVGSIVLFLFGMRMMSESLQKVAGNGMRRILKWMTKDYFTGIVSGLLITSIIQSSSASTVMFISFVNAGLLSLAESISLILGANIGTTITSWLIALLGFRFDVFILCLPLLAVSFPFIFSRKTKWRSWGEVVVGFSILFISLEFLKGAVPDINSNPHLLEFLSNYSGEGVKFLVLFVLVGLVLTVIIQSSSAMLALIIVMCGEGWIGFSLASAMVIGSNIGTTATVNIAALIANRAAKKAAFSHFFFNFVAAVISIFFFKYLLALSNFVSMQIGYESAFVSNLSIPVGLAVFHSLFNLLNVLIFVWFIKPFVRFLNYLYPKEVKEKFGLKYINTGILSTSELSLIQARKEVQNYAKHGFSMYKLSKQIMHSTDEKVITTLFDEISELENQMDKNEVVITQYLTRISENELSINSARQVRSLIKISDNIESIADNTYNLSRLLLRKSKQRIWFTPELRNSVFEMVELLDKAYDLMLINLNQALEGKVSLNSVYEIEDEINEVRNFLRRENMKQMKQKEYRYQAGVFFLDIITICENMGDQLVNISEALLDASDN
jgi:phosphate:Na+ symporter